jgi:hypothetical protein
MHLTQDNLETLSHMGFPMYSGCRNEAVAYAIEEMGISLDEILGKLSDDTVLTAIFQSIQVMGLMPYKD